MTFLFILCVFFNLYRWRVVEQSNVFLREAFRRYLVIFSYFLLWFLPILHHISFLKHDLNKGKRSRLLYWLFNAKFFSLLRHSCEVFCEQICVLVMLVPSIKSRFFDSCFDLLPRKHLKPYFPTLCVFLFALLALRKLISLKLFAKKIVACLTRASVIQLCCN